MKVLGSRKDWVEMAKEIFEKVTSLCEPQEDFYPGAYRYAVRCAEAAGGVCVFNSNEESGHTSFAPTLVFEFGDKSTLRITYSGCSVEE